MSSSWYVRFRMNSTVYKIYSVVRIVLWSIRIHTRITQYCTQYVAYTILYTLYATSLTMHTLLYTQCYATPTQLCVLCYAHKCPYCAYNAIHACTLPFYHTITWVPRCRCLAVHTILYRSYQKRRTVFYIMHCANTKRTALHIFTMTVLLFNIPWTVHMKF